MDQQTNFYYFIIFIIEFTIFIELVIHFYAHIIHIIFLNRSRWRSSGAWDSESRGPRFDPHWRNNVVHIEDWLINTQEAVAPS